MIRLPCRPAYRPAASSPVQPRREFPSIGRRPTRRPACFVSRTTRVAAAQTNHLGYQFPSGPDSTRPSPRIHDRLTSRPCAPPCHATNGGQKSPAFGVKAADRSIRAQNACSRPEPARETASGALAHFRRRMAGLQLAHATFAGPSPNCTWPAATRTVPRLPLSSTTRKPFPCSPLGRITGIEAHRSGRLHVHVPCWRVIPRFFDRPRRVRCSPFSSTVEPPKASIRHILRAVMTFSPARTSRPQLPCALRLVLAPAALAGCHVPLERPAAGSFPPYPARPARPRPPPARGVPLLPQPRVFAPRPQALDHRVRQLPAVARRPFCGSAGGHDPLREHSRSGLRKSSDAPNMPGGLRQESRSSSRERANCASSSGSRRFSSVQSKQFFPAQFRSFPFSCTRSAKRAGEE